MLPDFYIPRLLNDMYVFMYMKIALQENHLGGQILYRSLVVLKIFLAMNTCHPVKVARRRLYELAPYFFQVDLGKKDFQQYLPAIPPCRE